MTENERKIKKRVQWIVAGAMAVFFCLAVTLVVQLAVLGNRRAMERELYADQANLQQVLENTDKEIKYYESDKFIDEYILRELGYGKDGAKIFE